MIHINPLIVFCLSLLVISSLVSCSDVRPRVDQDKGVDPDLNYESLLNIGPWDDRNYNLTTEDVALLSENEKDIKDPIPAFFRVELRKNYPNLPRTGNAQYPRSALQMYIQMHGNYIVNGRNFDNVRYAENEYTFQRDGRNASGRSTGGSSTGEVRIAAPPSSDESAIKISPINPDIIVAGVNGPNGSFLQQSMYYSNDGGATWTRSTLPLGNTCCDPTVDWSSDGRFVYTATLGNCGSYFGCSVWFYRSSDNGQTWTDLESVTRGDSRREITDRGSDKEFLHVDKHPTSPFRDNVYLTWHESYTLQFARSVDFGNTWNILSFDNDPLGIGSDIITDKNGNIYYIYPAVNNNQIVLKRSTDGGNTFENGTITIARTEGSYDFPIPSIETRRAWIYVSADADLSDGPYGGSIYAAWTDTYTTDDNTFSQNNHTRIQVAYSRDGGNTWNVTTPHPTTDQNTVDRWNQWLAVGRDGTVHLVFYDTRHSSNRSGVDLYYCFSTDGAQSFSTPQRLSSITSANLADAQEFGDYNSLDHVVRQIATFADNRAENTRLGDSKDVYAVSTSLTSIGTWNPINSGTPEDLYTIHFPSNTVGYAAGSRGAVLKTTDSGDTWVSKNVGIPEAAYIYSIFFTDNNTGYAVGNFGSAYKTTDGGDSWNSFSLTPANIRNVFFIDTNKGFIVADDGLFRTLDAGITWENITNILPRGTNLISSELFFRDVNNGFILLQGAVLRTTDGGNSWTKINIPASATYDIDFVNANIGYLCGISTGVLRTSDAGLTWTKLVSFPSNTPQTLQFRDAKNGIVAGSNGAIYSTIDGGNSWTLDSSTATEDLHKVLYQASTGNYIAVGKGGMILRKE